MDVEVVEPLNICADSPRIEAIAMLGDGVTYAFSSMVLVKTLHDNWMDYSKLLTV